MLETYLGLAWPLRYGPLLFCLCPCHKRACLIHEPSMALLVALHIEHLAVSVRNFSFEDFRVAFPAKISMCERPLSQSVANDSPGAPKNEKAKN